MAHRITLLPGDGTGPEISGIVRRILAAADVDVDWDEQPLDGEQRLPERLLGSLRKNRVGLMAFHAGHRANALPVIVTLRNQLGMYANVRPLSSLRGLTTRHTDVDLVLVREVTEDIYAHAEHESIPGVYESFKVTTRAACERIARFAFEYARKKGRKKVTIVHKANIMKRSDGLFLATARGVAREYADIASDDVIVDALCMKLVLDPARFDVLVAGNLYGDIVADLCAGLVGGASNCPSINVSDDVHLFAAPHGDAVDVAGTGRANPLTLLMPAVTMLRHLDERAAADRIRHAVEGALVDGKRPFAIGGDETADAFADQVIRRL